MYLKPEICVVSRDFLAFNGHFHYFNDRNIRLFPEGFAFISCKYPHLFVFKKIFEQNK